MYCQNLHRTTQVRVCPSTLQVTVVVPDDTALTTPSEEIVATEESLILQAGVPEAPVTLMVKVSPFFVREKSVRLRESVPEEAEVSEEPEEPEGVG
ncbi:hypothetical protein SDC9_64238 [bioreactor metagenome]|uniref:Uncharacterized protein n=1 Tax=bioreactor metagenome TaxID=1076179 RepID=A0A644XNX3_9ZZZZ